jgi:hypothetical protein
MRIIYKKKCTLTWKGGPFAHGGEFPSSLVFCLKSTAFKPLALLSPPHLFSCQQYIYLHTDDITMPDPLSCQKDIN